ENHGLDYAYDRTERVKRDRKPYVGQSGEDSQHGMIGEHVGVETNAERKGAEQVVGQFDWKHQRRQKQDRAEKASQIAKKPFRPEPLVDKEAKADRAEGEGQVRIAGRRFHPRNKADE